MSHDFTDLAHAIQLTVCWERYLFNSRQMSQVYTRDTPYARELFLLQSAEIALEEYWENDNR